MCLNLNIFFFVGQENRSPAPQGREEQLRADRARAFPGRGGDQVHVQRRANTQGQQVPPEPGASQEVTINLMLN